MRHVVLSLICVLSTQSPPPLAAGVRQPSPQGTQPYTKDKFIELLEIGKDSAKRMTTGELFERAQKRGVKFRVTPLNEGDIRKAASYLNSSDLDRLIKILKGNYRPATSLSGVVEQVRVVDDPGGEYIYVFVRLSISNDSAPSVARNYRLAVVPANSQSLKISGSRPDELKGPFTVAGDGRPEVVIRSEDDLARKTAQEIQRGQPVSGWLRFILPQARLGPGKPQLKAEILRERGVWYVVSFDDWNDEPFEAAFMN
jgi:hypothetical protein